MKGIIKGKYLGINEGVFNDKPFYTGLFLCKRDNDSSLYVEKVSIRKPDDFSKIKFGDDMEFEVDVSNYNGRMSIVYGK